MNGIFLKKIEREKKIEIKKNEDDIANTLVKKEYLFKSMDAENIICLDGQFAEIVLSLKQVPGEQAKHLKKQTDCAREEGRDVNVVIIETHSKNGRVELKSISCK